MLSQSGGNRVVEMGKYQSCIKMLIEELLEINENKENIMQLLTH